MRRPISGKAVTNEKEHPYIVELAVSADKLEVQLSRTMMDFDSSRKIQARHGRRTVREGQIYYRWCFSDLATARAFMEQFGGEVLQSKRPKS
jgi:hypothetical protein